MLQPKTLEMARLYYQEGWKMKRIAEYFGVTKATVSKNILNADKRVCPISSYCSNCKLSDCIIKPEYRYMINRGTKKRPSTYGEIPTDFCCFCGQTCLAKEYMEVQDQEGNIKKYYFHKSCYYHNTIGYNRKYPRHKGK